MHKDLIPHLEALFDTYTDERHRSQVLKAKNEFFSITGAVNEDDDEFESRMNSFNEWYVFDFQDLDKEKTVVGEYIESNQLDSDLSQSLTEANHSLFEFMKFNFRKQMVLKDYIHDRKIVLSKDQPKMSLLPDDIFVGRVLQYKNEYYLLNGICVVPKEVKSILKKQAKKVRRLRDPQKELEFLLHLEALKLKWLRYGHVESHKIFMFDV